MDLAISNSTSPPSFPPPPLPHCQGESQECSSITDISSGDIAVLVNTTGTLCVRCLDSNGQTSGDTEFTVLDLIITSELSAIAIPGLTVDNNGVLRILNPGFFIPDGTSSLSIDCQARNFEFFYRRIMLFSSSKHMK